MGLNSGRVLLLSAHFWFCCVSFFPSIFHCLSISLPLSMSVGWFMALFKWRPHVSPDAAICFNPTSFFHSLSFEGNQEPTKINPWLVCAQQSVLCSASCLIPASEELDRDSYWVQCGSDEVPCRPNPPCCSEDTSNVEKWHATRMPLIMLTGKVGKMANVTNPFYQPNFIRRFHVWAGKNGYFSSFFIL